MPPRYSARDWHEAQAAWSAGGFGPEWRDVRRLAAERGFCYPPTGDAGDSREDAEPSQRAILWAALRDRPASTAQLVRRSRSWSETVGRILLEEQHLREDADLRAWDDEWHRREEPTPQQALVTVGTILAHIADSVAR